ncbi:PP2C family protein-serine/threonine phosphatase [Streptomyces sp. 71268]|uniref:PP2C family protein-serine/threonine phosphatase n=1 Tax=Streptomyces sp. 71268 TaxID=3002640 RepID=UPI0023F6EC1D|nr:PP2C family protein-serine/threonine phosphatase [Streptomyces sp. 71268]WEV28805.1 PP2C family protein-serine/threonine phosphatase [Streptomyces sp. 71268]
MPEPMGVRCEAAAPPTAPGPGHVPGLAVSPTPGRPARLPRPASAAGGVPGASRPRVPAGRDAVAGVPLPRMLTAASRNVPADSGAASGDVCAVRQTPYGLRLLIGDVRGKGPGAAVGAAALRRAFDRAADRVPTLSVLVDTLEWALVGATARPAGSGAADGADAAEDSAENFATVLVAEVSPDGHALRLVNRGHPAPLLLRRGQVRRLEPRQRLLPLGLGAVSGAGQVPAPAGPYADEVAFPEGASLLLFTDGVTEARDAHGVFYDPLARLARFAGAAPADLLDVLHRDVLRHAGAAHGARALSDDLAMVAVRRAPWPVAGPVTSGARRGRSARGS